LIFSAVYTVGLPSAVLSAKPRLAAPKTPHVFRVNKTTLELYWDRVSGADGYRIYRYSPKQNKYVCIKKTVKRTLWIDYHLTTDKTYRYRVAAYRIEEGKRIVGKKSYVVSARAYSSNAKKVNAGKVWLGERSTTIGLNERYPLEAQVRPSKAGKNKKKKVYNTRLLYSSKNTSIATVTKKGTARGKKVGTTTLIVRAHNGNLAYLKVHVKDWANPKQFILWETSEETSMVLSDQEKEIKAVATYFNWHRNAGPGTLYLDENNALVNNNGVELGAVKDLVYKLLIECPYDMVLQVSDSGLEFQLRIPFDADNEDNIERLFIRFRYDFDPLESDLNKIGYVKIAPHWFTGRYMAPH
jgi:hypothetical protein